MNPVDERTVLTATQFAEQVMAAIAHAPTPTPTRAFVASLRARAGRDALAALWVAWHLGTVRSWHVAPGVRARSFALVLAVTSVLATGGLAAAAAVHSVVPQRDARTPVSAPSVDAGPTGNGLTATDDPDGTDQSPTTSEDPAATDHADSDGRHASTGAQPDKVDDHDRDQHDGDEADDGDGPDDSNKIDDGSDGDQAPVTTDDHRGSDGGDAPEQSYEPDHSSDGGGSPDPSAVPSGSSDGGDERDDTSGAGSGGD